MGSYIHAYVEHRTNGQWFPAGLPGLVDPDKRHAAQVLNWQDYTMFGWLGNVADRKSPWPTGRRK